MKMLKIASMALIFSSITGCAELSVLNQKVGNWAGEINTMLNADK